MNDFPTYYDLKYEDSSKIFEAEQIRDLSPDEIEEGEKLYNEIIEKVKNGEEIDEGLLGGIVGGAAGALVGPAIGKAICKVLGIDQKGHLGKLLTSRLVTTAMGVALGR